MNAVKREEDPEIHGFTHTRLGMDRIKQKEKKQKQMQSAFAGPVRR